MFSTLHKDAVVEPNGVQKPKIILDCSQGKRGVDTLDQVVRFYSCSRTTRRWPFTIFFNLLNISCYNALVLFLHIHPEYEHASRRQCKRFLIKVVAPLCAHRALPPTIFPAPRQVTPQKMRSGSKRCEFRPRHIAKKLQESAPVADHIRITLS